MRALCWHGKNDIRCDHVPDPQIEAPRDAIVTRTKKDTVNKNSLITQLLKRLSHT